VITAVFAHDDCLALINVHALHVIATLPAVPIVRPVCERRDGGRQKTGGQGAGQNKSAIKNRARRHNGTPEPEPQTRRVNTLLAFMDRSKAQVRLFSVLVIAGHARRGGRLSAYKMLNRQTCKWGKHVER
jgi:hypothetical protein